MSLQLGKKPHLEDTRDWQWTDFRKSLKSAGALPKVPTTFGHGNTFHDWKMLANGPDPTAPGVAKEGAGCCVWSSADHETMEALTDAGQSAISVGKLFDGRTAIDDYESTGYRAATGEHDEGTEVRESLLYRQQTGILDTTGKRHKIGPFMAIDFENTQHLLEALFFFEGLPIGFIVQQAQMDAFNRAEAAGTVPIWDYVPGSSQIGGHCIPLVGRPDGAHFTGLSWALRLFCTPSLLSHLCDEAWAYVTPERISKVTGKSYEGASPAQLEEYLHVVGKTAVSGDKSLYLRRAAA